MTEDIVCDGPLWSVEILKTNVYDACICGEKQICMMLA